VTGAAARLPRPRPTARLRLTLLYGGLFTVAGAALLGFTYWLFERGTNDGKRILPTPPPGRGISCLPTDHRCLQLARAWVAQHGTMTMPTDAAVFGSNPHILFATPAFYPHGSSLQPQFMSGLPVALAPSHWIGGIPWLLRANVVIGCFALLSFAGFVARAIGRAHTIAPDALARNSKPVTIEKVDEEREIKDAAMTVDLYHIAGNPHADTLLMAYFPKQRILVEADAFSPGAAVQPYAANLLENIRKRNLKVDRILPLHGTIAPFGDLVKTKAATQ
jgi:hypothetical protein